MSSLGGANLVCSDDRGWQGGQLGFLVILVCRFLMEVELIRGHMKGTMMV